MSVTTPERTLFDIVQLGLDTIEADNNSATADESELDKILAYLGATERAKVRAAWAQNPPTLVFGFAREDHPFPLVSMTLASEPDHEYYLDDAGKQIAALDAEYLGIEQDEHAIRVAGTYNFMCYHEHPDMCAHLYRVMKRIMQVGTRRIMAAGLDDPKFNGQDLAPWQKPSGDLLYVRRLSVTVEYNETWLTTGALWAALNGTTPMITDPDQLNVHHEDSGGAVTPYTLGD